MKNKILSISFFLFIFGFFITNLVVKDLDISYSERRHLKVLPKFTIKNVFNGEISGNFEEYALDHFVLRDNFRSLKSLVNFNILGKKDNNNLYYENKYIYKIEYPLNEKKVISFTEKMNKLYKNRLSNSKVYYSIIPDKNYYTNNDSLKMDYNALIDIVKNNIDKNLEYIDITDTLSLEDYYYTDIHWRQENLFKVVDKFSSSMNFETGKSYKKNIYDTFYGSYYGQLGLKLEPDKLMYLTNKITDNAKVEDISSDLKSVYETNSLGSIDSYDVFLGGATPIVSLTNTYSTSDRELIIFRDSFASSLAPLLLNGYKKITLVDLRYIDESLLGEYLDFQDKDILLLYNTTIINNSDIIKV